jgi:hypothetical protein
MEFCEDRLSIKHARSKEYGCMVACPLPRIPQGNKVMVVARATAS